MMLKISFTLLACLIGMETFQVVGLLEETEPTEEIAMEASESEAYNEDDDEDGDGEGEDMDEDEDDEEDEEEDGESIDEIPAKGAVVKSSAQDTFDMDDRDDDSYYTVSSGESADGVAEASVTARLPPEPISARLARSLSLTHPSETANTEKIEGTTFNCLLMYLHTIPVIIIPLTLTIRRRVGK